MSRDKLIETLVQALKDALASPQEQRLFRSGKLEGLFSSRNGTSKEAAHYALDHGLLEVTRTEERGEVKFDWVTITPEGVEFLHEQESPIHALRELRDVLQINQEFLPNWLAQMQERLSQLQRTLTTESERWQHQLEALSTRVDQALKRLERASPILPEELLASLPWAIQVLTYLDRREETAEKGQLCTLPELFNAVRREHAELSLSEFHDGLKRLQVQRAIRLLPVESEEGLSQPEYALFDGTTILYLVARDA